MSQAGQQDGSAPADTLDDRTRLLPGTQRHAALVQPEAPGDADEQELDGAPTRMSIYAGAGSRSASSSTGIPEPDARERLKLTLLAGGGARIGRYMLLRVLGEGGMGVVFAAYDEELDRRVALKVLSIPREHANQGRGRMKREAQALAKLSHPNVVQIYDVGDFSNQLYIAMEFVEGQTLHEWMREVQRPRAWRDVLATFIPAGRGLAAAHSAGLVHRDFKPQNVILGVDGRPRVLDFGLAKQEGSAAPEELEGSGDAVATASDGVSIESGISGFSGFSGVSRGASTSLTAQLTEVGSVVGTPAYMSPEQFASREVTARSDQFSFCVALYEALYGARPFKAKGRRQYELHVRTGRFADPPRGAGVPPWLLRALHRGLSPEPGERWPSMDALLAALSRDPGQLRRRAAAVALLTAGVAGGAYGVARYQAAQAPRCTGGAQQLAATWGDGERAELNEAFAATGLNYGAEVAERVTAQLDDYTARWSLARRESCELGLRREISGALLDLRNTCLDERLGAVRARVSLLLEADAETVENATKTVASLPRLAPCSDNAYLQAAVKPPDDPALAERVAATRERLELARARIDAGKYAEGTAEAAALLEEARALGYEPLIATAGFATGFGETEAGDSQKAITLLTDAYHTALGAGDDETAALTASYLVFILGGRLARYEDARRWTPHAASMVKRVGESSRASVQFENGLGAMAQKSGDAAAADAHFSRALELAERLFGPKDTRTALLYSNLAAAYAAQQRWGEAESAALTALEVMEAGYGPNHPIIALPLTNLSIGYQYQGKFEKAFETMGRALEIRESALGPEHVSVSTMLVNIGSIQEKMGRDDDALVSFERALEIREAALGSENPRLGILINNLANLKRKRGEFADAKRLFKRAIEVHEKGVGPDHASLLVYLSGYALTCLQNGEPREAVAALERGLELEEVEHNEDAVLAEVHFTLARARYDLAGKNKAKRAAAVELARTALKEYEGYGDGFPSERAEAKAWIAARAR